VNPELLRRLLLSTPSMVGWIGLFPADANQGQAVFASTGDVSDFVDLDAMDGDSPKRPPARSILLLARTLTDLRRAVSLGALLPNAKQLRLVVAEPSSQFPLTAPALLPEGPAVSDMKAAEEASGEWVLEVLFSKTTRIGPVLSAVMRAALGPAAIPGPRVALAGPGAAHWRPGDAGVVPSTIRGPLIEPSGFVPADVALRSVGSDAPRWRQSDLRVVDRPPAHLLTWTALTKPGSLDNVRAYASSVPCVELVPPVDERTVNPIGFVSAPIDGVARLGQTGDGWVVRCTGSSPLPIHPSGALTDADIATLRRYRAVRVDWGRHTGPIAAVRTVAGLAAAGVPLATREVPDWAGGLGTELVNLITRVKVAELEDDIAREEHSIRVRRVALRTHSTRARWAQLATASGLSVPQRPRVSVLLCTRRPNFIAFGLAQISRQRHVDLEVVLTLHGQDAETPEVKAAIEMSRWPVTVVQVPGEVAFGDALNRGAAAATGAYIAKWDDDDWYGPEFIADALLAAEYSGADLVGCLHQFIYLGPIKLTVHRPGGESERFTRRISGNSLLMSRNVFEGVGGFPPIGRSVDTGLLRALEAAGARIYRTHGMASMVYRRSSGHTWNPPLTDFIRAAAGQWRGFRPSALMEFPEFSEEMNSLMSPR
jgi:hypothetical protein